MPATPLDYAPPPPWRRRRVRRWLILALLAAAMTPALWYRQPLWRRANLLYYGWQCGRYTAPADQLIYSTAPADVARLANDPRYATGRRFRDAAAYVIARPPECWVRWYKAAGARAQQVRPPGNAIAFLHALRHKSGQQWLVAFDWSGGTQLSYTLRGNAISGELQRGMGQCQGGSYALVASKAPLRVFAGQPDPADPSHFTIRYELAGRSEFIDGFLTDDNNIKLIVPVVERLRSASAEAR